MPKTVPYVILFLGRTGSTYLHSALKSHPDIYARGEELIDFMRNGRTTRVREILAGEMARGHRAAGFNTKFTDIGDRERFGEMLKAINARIIYLGRRNRVKHVVSFFTGMKLFEGTGHWNLHKKVERDIAGPIQIDINDFDKKLREIERQNSELLHYVAKLELPTLCIYYEDLLRFEKQMTNTILQLLNVPIVPLKGTTRKNTSDDLRNVLANFDELQAFYADTRYSAMFEQVISTCE